MHPFIHPFNPATDPAWEARTNWDQFKAIRPEVLELAGKHLGVRKDMVATALLHDTPGEIGQPFGEVETGAGATRNPYPARRCLISRSWSGLSRHLQDVLPRSAPTSPSPAAWARRVCRGRARRNTVARRVSAWFPSRASSEGMPRIDNAKDACEIMLALSPESNGDVGVRSWAGLEKADRFQAQRSFRPVQDQHLTFEGITARPQKGFTSRTGRH